MNDSDQDDIIDLNEIGIALAKGVVILILFILSLRFPVLWIKIPLTIVILFIGWRWIFKKKKKAPSGSSLPAPKQTTTGTAKIDQRSKIEHYEAAVGRAAKPDQNVVRLLLAYDAAGEFGKAKTLIQKLEGEELPESVAEEFASLAKNYFPIELEPTGNGFRFKLV